jgi:elongation factor G
VSFREIISKRASFNFTHKRQSGGAGQFGRVIGYIEPLPEEERDKGFVFVNEIVGNAIPPEFYNAVEKGTKRTTDHSTAAGRWQMAK